ncbi:MAG TPA: sigma-70 family RNA polymerase sigma factor [Thermoanaerobaculia bacterium]|jgi:RNA polymerase sigma-70 factor (ECF subfamily)|nr:sigma-70 family RNA polymerase sigma factor [Thermoanaerobaculia bacterium]
MKLSASASGVAALDPVGVKIRSRPAPEVKRAVRVALSEASDEQLIEHLVQGESQAFTEILGRYRDKVYQFARWSVDADEHEAEDITQEVFLQVFRSARSYRGDSKFRTWLYSLTRNVCRQHAARRKVRRMTTADISYNGEDWLQEIPDSRPSPLAEVEVKERQQLLRQAVERLGAIHRSVLLLRDWEGLPYEEIAAVLEIPVGTVRSRLFHARAALARELESYFSDRKP